MRSARNEDAGFVTQTTIDLFTTDPSPNRVPQTRNTHFVPTQESCDILETREAVVDPAPYNKFVESPEKEIDPKMDMEDCMAYLHSQIQDLEF